MQHDSTMDVYPMMSIKIEKCFCEDLNQRGLLNDCADINCNTSMNYSTPVFKRTFRKIPNILKNSTRLHRITEINEIYDTSEQAAENPVAKEENKKQQKRISRRKQELPPLQVGTCFNGRKKKSDESPKKLRMRRERRKHEAEGETSVVVNEQKIECHSLSTDFSSGCQAPSLLQKIDEKVLQDSIDFTSNEIFNTFYYEFYDNNLNPPVEMISNDWDPSYSIYASSAMDVNDNECDSCQRAEDENKESISANKPISVEYWDTDNDCYCDFCLEHCVSNMIDYEIDNLKQNLLVEAIDKDSHTNNTNEDTSINLTIEQDFLPSDIDSTLITFVDTNGEIADRTMFDALAVHRATVHQGEYTLCESCGMLFSQRDKFDKHLVSCRCDRRFICETCRKVYRHKSSLHQHLKIKHYRPIDGSNLFTCTVCEKPYRRFGRFLNHIKTHENYL